MFVLIRTTIQGRNLALSVLPWQQPAFQIGEEKKHLRGGGPPDVDETPPSAIVHANVTSHWCSGAPLWIESVVIEVFRKFWPCDAPSSYLAGPLICAAPSLGEWSPCTAECRPSCTGAMGHRKQLLRKHALQTQATKSAAIFPLVCD